MCEKEIRMYSDRMALRDFTTRGLQRNHDENRRGHDCHLLESAVSKMDLPPYLCAMIISNLVIHCYGCTQEQSRFGCRIQERECLCGVGCEIEYRYSSSEDCLTALNGPTKDACSIKPCRNGGSCVTEMRRMGFICHCTNTGYYGAECEKPCPSFNKAIQNGLPINFPSDCIIV